MQQEVKIKGWLVRDKDDYTAIYSKKPIRGKTEWIDSNCSKSSSESSCILYFSEFMFPEITWESEPIEVELTIKTI